MPSAELKAALDAASAAAEVIRPFYRQPLSVQIKSDQSPVTEADLKAEQAIRRVLESRFPDYGIYGEEGGKHAMEASSIWLVDPLDGTKSFVRESPFFSTQIALWREGRAVLGVSLAPVYGELAWAEEGTGAFLDGERIRVSATPRLEQAILSTGNLKTLAASSGWARFGKLVGQLNRLRGYGDFLHYHLLARGSLDAVIESDLNVLDIAALSVIVREAGGQFTELDGAPISLATTTVLASNGPLHAPILAAMRG